MKKLRGRRRLWVFFVLVSICLDFADGTVRIGDSFTYTVIGSAGMTGKSSGDGKCVRPKVCHSTTSALSRLALGSAAIQAGRPWEGSPEVWGT